MPADSTLAKKSIKPGEIVKFLSRVKEGKAGLAFYTKRANEKPPVGKRRGLVRNLTAAEQSGSQEEAGNINKFVSVCSTGTCM